MRRPRRAALGLALPGFTRPASLVWNIPLCPPFTRGLRGVGEGRALCPPVGLSVAAPVPVTGTGIPLAILMPLVPGQCPPRLSLFGVRGSVGEGSEGCCSRGRGPWKPPERPFRGALSAGAGRGNAATRPGGREVRTCAPGRSLICPRSFSFSKFCLCREHSFATSQCAFWGIPFKRVIGKQKVKRESLTCPLPAREIPSPWPGRPGETGTFASRAQQSLAQLAGTGLQAGPLYQPRLVPCSWVA